MNDLLTQKSIASPIEVFLYLRGYKQCDTYSMEEEDVYTEICRYDEFPEEDDFENYKERDWE